MKNLDILADAISKEKASAPAETPEPKLSDDDVKRIASKMVELMSNKTDSVTDESGDESESKDIEAEVVEDGAGAEKTESEGGEDGYESDT